MDITQFFTPDNANLLKDLIMSGFIIMLFTQATKGFVDSFFNWLPFVKKAPSTSLYVFILSIVQAICVMFMFYGYGVTAETIYFTIANACLLYVGCTQGFNFVFKNITIKKPTDTVVLGDAKQDSGFVVKSESGSDLFTVGNTSKENK